MEDTGGCMVGISIDRVPSLFLGLTIIYLIVLEKHTSHFILLRTYVGWTWWVYLYLVRPLPLL